MSKLIHLLFEIVYGYYLPRKSHERSFKVLKKFGKELFSSRASEESIHHDGFCGCQTP